MKPELYVSSTTETLEGGYIYPRVEPSVFVKGLVLTGQSDPMFALSSAMRNYDAEVVFSVGQLQFDDTKKMPYILARDKRAFLDSLHIDPSGHLGGFVHNVDTTEFDLMLDRSAQTKWFAQKRVRVIAPPRFVSLEHVMSQGIQIYILQDMNFAQTLALGKRQHEVLISEGYDSKRLSCLNEVYGFKRLEIPPLCAPDDREHSPPARPLSHPSAVLASEAAKAKC